MNTTKLGFAQRVALAAIVAIMVALSWLAPLDLKANAQVDAGLKRALVTFATARALNGVISAVQGTELAVEPAGVGVVFAPGQVLDPVNDLVEQFSSLMLAASVAFGVQKVLLSIGAYWLVSAMLSITALAWTYFYFRRRLAPAWLSRVLVVLLTVRFAIPVVTIGTDLLFEQFMVGEYQSSQNAIDSASGNLAKLNKESAVQDADKGILERFKGWWSQHGDVGARFEQLKQTAERATERIISLMAIFLLQTLIIPLLLLWVLYQLVRGTFERPALPSR